MNQNYDKKRLFIISSITLIIIILYLSIKYYINISKVNIDNINQIITIISIFFGFLSGFFITALWSRYVEIRSLQGARYAESVKMYENASYFFNTNDKFKNSFLLKFEKTSIADEVININEGHLEFNYFIDIGKSFKHIEFTDTKSSIYFEYLKISYGNLIDVIIRMDALYKEKLFFSEWLLMAIMSFILLFTTIFIKTDNLFFNLIVLLIPIIIIITIYIIYILNEMILGKELITTESNQIVFDLIGKKRFHLKSELFYIKNIDNIRNEDDLKGELREVYDDIMKKKVN